MTLRSKISVDVLVGRSAPSQPTSHHVVGFPDMISDNKLQAFS